MRLMLKKSMEIFGRIRKNKKQNNITVDMINGNIIQDSSVENNYVTISDPAIAIRNIGKNPGELTECFKSVRDSLAPQHKLYPYYETGIQEINGKHIFCMANENDSNGLKIVFTYDLVTRKVGFTYIKTL